LSLSGAEKRWLKVFRILNEFQARLFVASQIKRWIWGVAA